ncbi:MAG: hypothetical protein A2428_09665 [Bdellovibrionales bacterium RIFOXYC1_FULL_54_43]|nr:MAG: hypothetical protein A2428_09665 [Bdellovibrionales bacterium RIFOXYC1_FULL_54_43]OFZ84683.1 MAG: hypothetical protein A2603_13765 [Bdellovibrionales bacterium RIFOXYD1_FULL_55_31]
MGFLEKLFQALFMSFLTQLISVLVLISLFSSAILLGTRRHVQTTRPPAQKTSSRSIVHVGVQSATHAAAPTR